jgi:hypothetical protein
VAVVAAMAAYLVIFGRRLVTPRVEQPRTLRILPIRGAAGAKLLYLGWRALAPFVLAAAPCVGRAPEPARLAMVVLGIAAVGWIVASAVVRVQSTEKPS